MLLSLTISLARYVRTTLIFYIHTHVCNIHRNSMVTSGLWMFFDFCGFISWMWC